VGNGVEKKGQESGHVECKRDFVVWFYAKSQAFAIYDKCTHQLTIQKGPSAGHSQPGKSTISLMVYLDRFDSQQHGNIFYAWSSTAHVIIIINMGSMQTLYFKAQIEPLSQSSSPSGSLLAVAFENDSIEIYRIEESQNKTGELGCKKIAHDIGPKSTDTVKFVSESELVI
jgi:hypothetical protein